MKTFRFFLIIVITFLTMARITCAEDQIIPEKIDLSIDDTSINSYSNNNPFKSQLPKIEKSVKTDQTNNFGFNPSPEQHIEPVPAPEPVKPTPPNLTLNGIVWNTNRPQAIINGQVVNQGDYIEGAKIVSIRKSGINLIFEDVSFMLKP